MNKKTVYIVMSVVLGIAAFTIATSVISMLFNAILAGDPITVSEPSKTVEDIILYIKHSYVAVGCIGIPTVVCYFLTYFSKQKKIFALISALLSLLLILMCIGFIFDLRSTVLDLTEYRSSCYTLATACFNEMFKMLVSCVFACAYFTVIAVYAFRNEKSASQSEPAVEQTTAMHETVKQPETRE